MKLILAKELLLELFSFLAETSDIQITLDPANALTIRNPTESESTGYQVYRNAIVFRADKMGNAWVLYLGECDNEHCYKEYLHNHEMTENPPKHLFTIEKSPEITDIVVARYYRNNKSLEQIKNDIESLIDNVEFECYAYNLIRCDENGRLIVGGSHNDSSLNNDLAKLLPFIKNNLITNSRKTIPTLRYRNQLVDILKRQIPIILGCSE